MITRIDSRFFVADDGRLIFRTLRAFVVIPEADLWLVRRRNFQANAAGAGAVLVSNIGWPPAYWRPWWLLVGIGVWAAAFLWVARWVRERYPEVNGPHDTRDLRDAPRTHTRPAGFDLFSGAIALLSAGFALVGDRPRSPAVLFMLVALTHFTGAFRRWKQEREPGAESYANVPK